MKKLKLSFKQLNEEFSAIKESELSAIKGGDWITDFFNSHNQGVYTSADWSNSHNPISSGGHSFDINAFSDLVFHDGSSSNSSGSSNVQPTNWAETDDNFAYSVFYNDVLNNYYTAANYADYGSDYGDYGDYSNYSNSGDYGDYGFDQGDLGNWDVQVSDGGVINIYRTWETNNSTVDTFTTGSGLHGYIMEPAGPSTTERNQDRRIPAGVYNLLSHINTRLHSEWELYNDQVPGDNSGALTRAILFHSGNKPSQTAGCLMPGFTRANDWVGDSVNAVNALNDYIDSFHGKVVVNIYDPKKP
jgi:hypothetical protein